MAIKGKLKKGRLIKLFTGPKKVISDAFFRYSVYHPEFKNGNRERSITLMDLRSGVHQTWDYDCVIRNGTELTEMDIVLYVKKEFL